MNAELGKNVENLGEHVHETHTETQARIQMGVLP